ncbi:hypothetical protein QCA50_011049 [Cerrena zonata]|uniref:Uncharacterized protein n=1 Tax=Cerrena zonata TaxID=2478898 RepID=A0AAW0G9K8_9APHY
MDPPHPYLLHRLLTNSAQFNHLDDEVSHISAETLKVFDEVELKKMCDDMNSYAKSHGDPTMNVPFMRSHTPAEFKITGLLCLGLFGNLWPRC